MVAIESGFDQMGYVPQSSESSAESSCYDVCLTKPRTSSDVPAPASSFTEKSCIGICHPTYRDTRPCIGTCHAVRHHQVVHRHLPPDPTRHPPAHRHLPRGASSPGRASASATRPN
ncbi:hypothetical protein TKK_0009443 [Trichogramma kaykai]